MLVLAKFGTLEWAVGDFPFPLEILRAVSKLVDAKLSVTISFEKARIGSAMTRRRSLGFMNGMFHRG